jgi:membrane protease YdiL (CAAX protease family)
LSCIECGEALSVPSIESGDRSSAFRLGSALSLYFVMLGTILGPAAIFDTFSVTMLVWVSIANLTLVVAWGVLSWPRLRGVVLNAGRPEDWGWALSLVPVTVLLALGTEAFFVEVFDFARPHTFLTVYDHFASVPVLLFLMAAMPAFVEEVAFRGIIFDGLEGLLGRREVIIATALMFMILHLALLSLVFLLVMGLFLGWLRHRSGSVWPSIALHFLHNAIVVLWSLGRSAGG